MEPAGLPGKDIGNGLRALNFPATGNRKARQGVRNRTDRSTSLAGASKEQAGSVDPEEVAWKRAAASGERKAVSRRRLRRRSQAGHFRRSDPQRSKAVAGSKGSDRGGFPNAEFEPCMPAGEHAATKSDRSHVVL